MGFNPVIPISTIWGFEHIRNGKVIDSWKQGNVLTDQGLNHMLNVTFHGATRFSPWYMALFSDDFTPLASNTYASPGYTEFTGYSETYRIPYVESPASAKTMSNIANRSAFTMNAAATLYGTALVGGGLAPAVKGDKDDTFETPEGTGGVLFCASRFAAAKVMLVGDILMVSCTIILEDV